MVGWTQLGIWPTSPWPIALPLHVGHRVLLGPENIGAGQCMLLSVMAVPHLRDY